MLKKTITFMDYDGHERTEDYYFNLSKAELADMQMSEYGGLDKLLTKIINTNDNVKLYQYFRDIVQKSYGVKSLDGKRFIKDPEETKAFTETEAYSVLIMELIQDADAASNFINSIIPQDLEEAVKKQTANGALPDLKVVEPKSE